MLQSKPLNFCASKWEFCLKFFFPLQGRLLKENGAEEGGVKRDQTSFCRQKQRSKKMPVIH
jgi:hypothetical protein